MKKSILLLTVFLGATLGAEYFRSGRHAVAYEIDQAKKSMKVIAETAYDPKKDEGASVYTLFWNSRSRFYVQKSKTLNSIKPGTPGWFFLTSQEAAKVRKGETFYSSRIEFEPERDGRFGFRSAQKLYAPVYPAEKGRGGEIELGGKRIKFRSPGRVTVFSKGTVRDIKSGETKLRIFGVVSQKKFQVSRANLIEQPALKLDPVLPNVLVIGDSISMNYEQALKKALAGKMNCLRIDGNSGDSNRGNRAIRMWLRDFPGKKSRWAVVVLNHGLHDLKQKADPKTKKFSPKHQVEPAVYARNIDRLLKYLTTNKYKVVWCTTTPVPGNSYGAYARRKDEDLVYNNILKPILKKYPQVTVCDLNAAVRSSKVFDQWRKGTNVHFRTEAERKVLGDAVAAAILKAHQK